MAAGRGHGVGRERQPLAGGDPELPLDQVEAVDELGDRVLDLEPGVHLHEEELELRARYPRAVAVARAVPGTMNSTVPAPT